MILNPSLSLSMRAQESMALSLASEAQPLVARIASRAWSPSMECQLISGSFTMVSLILAGSRSSHPAVFFLKARITGFFPWASPHHPGNARGLIPPVEAQESLVNPRQQ